MDYYEAVFCLSTGYLCNLPGALDLRPRSCVRAARNFDTQVYHFRGGRCPPMSLCQTLLPRSGTVCKTDTVIKKNRMCADE